MQQDEMLPNNFTSSKTTAPQDRRNDKSAETQNAKIQNRPNNSPTNAQRGVLPKDESRYRRRHNKPILNL